MAHALDGIKVVDVSTMAAVPMAARHLADFGADVIHVENPATGDPWRWWLTAGGRELSPEVNYRWWENQNRNKRSITLDLSQERGREILYKLAEKADVFLTNFRPSELERYSLQYSHLSNLNPKLIYGNLTGYGKTGTDKDLPGFDSTAFWCRSGLLYMLQQAGMPPPSPGNRLLACGDNVTALALAFGVMMALFVRDRTGIGQEIDLALFHTAVYTLLAVPLALGMGEEATLTDRKDTPALTNSYQTKDGRWLQLSLAPPDRYWSGLCRAIEREDLEHDSRFESFEARAENQATLIGIMEEVFLGETLSDWNTRLARAGMIFAPIESPLEVTADHQARANDFFTSYEHPDYGNIEVIANPVKLSQTPAVIRMPAPEFNQHTEEVLLELEYSWEDIAQLKDNGVIA